MIFNMFIMISGSIQVASWVMRLVEWLERMPQGKERRGGEDGSG